MENRGRREDNRDMNHTLSTSSEEAEMLGTNQNRTRVGRQPGAQIPETEKDIDMVIARIMNANMNFQDRIRTKIQLETEGGREASR